MTILTDILSEFESLKDSLGADLAHYLDYVQSTTVAIAENRGRCDLDEIKATSQGRIDSMSQKLEAMRCKLDDFVFVVGNAK